MAIDGLVEKLYRISPKDGHSSRSLGISEGNQQKTNHETIVWEKPYVNT